MQLLTYWRSYYSNAKKTKKIKNHTSKSYFRTMDYDHLISLT